MKDEDLEALLRAYRPLGPPKKLRGAIMAALRPPRTRLRDWYPAAAAVILAVIFSWLAGVERQRLSASVTPMPPIEQAAIEELER
jgi:hypothetical protein